MVGGGGGEGGKRYPACMIFTSYERFFCFYLRFGTLFVAEKKKSRLPFLSYMCLLWQKHIINHALRPPAKPCQCTVSSIVFLFVFILVTRLHATVK